MTKSPIGGTNLQQPLPIYPPPLQALRVTGGTIPGPSGYASSSMLGPSLYLAFTQQLNPTTLLPRDREPCLVLDLNRRGLTPGYYLGRLVSNYQSLPLYEVAGASAGVLNIPVNTDTPAPASPPEPTIETTIQLATLTTPQQAILNNLTPSQLQTLVTSVPLSQIHTLTLTLNSTQLSNFVSLMTSSQFTNLYTQLTTSQIINLTSLNINQINNLTTVLTPAQISSIITNLTSIQLATLSNMTPAQVYTLVTNLTTSQLQTILSPTPIHPIIYPGVNEQTGTSYTVLPDDNGKLLTFTNTGVKGVTIPAASTLGPRFATFIQNNAATGNLTITPVSGLINGASSLTVSATQGAAIFSDGTNWQVWTPLAGATISGGGGGAGSLLDANYVLTNESTNSTSFVALATTDEIGFTLSSTSNVLLKFSAQCSIPSGIMAETASQDFYVDGSLNSSETAFTIGTNGGTIPVTVQAIVTGMAAGSHTVAMRYKTLSGGSISWSRRVVEGYLLP